MERVKRWDFGASLIGMKTFSVQSERSGSCNSLLRSDSMVSICPHPKPRRSKNSISSFNFDVDWHRSSYSCGKSSFLPTELVFSREKIPSADSESGLLAILVKERFCTIPGILIRTASDRIFLKQLERDSDEAVIER